MRTAEHMEHRNLERKWRPSFALGPHLTEGRSIDERRRLSWLERVYARRLWGPRGFIARDPLNRNRGGCANRGLHRHRILNPPFDNETVVRVRENETSCLDDLARGDRGRRPYIRSSSSVSETRKLTNSS